MLPLLAALLRLRRLCGLGSVGAEHRHFHTTVLFTSLTAFAFVNRLVLAETHDLNAVHRHIVLADEVGLHRFGAATAQIEVVLDGASLVGVTLNGDEISFEATDLTGGHLI